ncbi:MAG: MFS transporter [Schleiferilactobacillus harbinensis]|uniref:MFS transporter n=1 Tax=Schleiferilactobacillus perolens TaxID=100468 RepID=UPI0039EA7B69|nr:MFS transporter [Schleiferilactobacillus harbinensis]MCI1912186.1 MFS transporter [Schleiferilactobacillus harbinensis]
MNKNVARHTQLAILAVGLLSFTGILVETSLNVTYYTLTKQLGVSLSVLQWLTSGYLLMVTIVMSTTAYLIQRFAAQRLFQFAVAASLVGTTLCAIAPSFPILLLGRLCQAVATGIATPLMFYLIMALIPHRQLGQYMGLASMIISLAPALGPTYGGWLTALWSWRLIFVMIIPVVLVVFWLGQKFIHLPAKSQQRRFDWPGLLFLAVALVSLSEGVESTGTLGWYTLTTWAWATIFIAAVVLLVNHARRTESPLLNFKVLADPAVAMWAIVFFCLQFANIGLSFLLPQFTQNVLQSSALTAGLMLLPGSILGGLMSPVAGSVYDKIGPRWPLLVSNGAILLSCLLLWGFTGLLTGTIITLLYMFFRFGFNFGFGNTMSDASTRVSGPLKGDLSSIFNTLQQYAGSMGTSVLAAILAANERLMPDKKAAITQGSQQSFFLIAMLGLLGIVLTILITKHRKARR